MHTRLPLLAVTWRLDSWTWPPPPLPIHLLHLQRLRGPGSSRLSLLASQWREVSAIPALPWPPPPLTLPTAHRQHSRLLQWWRRCRRHGRRRLQRRWWRVLEPTRPAFASPALQPRPDQPPTSSRLLWARHGEEHRRLLLLLMGRQAGRLARPGLICAAKKAAAATGIDSLSMAAHLHIPAWQLLDVASLLANFGGCLTASSRFVLICSAYVDQRPPFALRLSDLQGCSCMYLITALLWLVLLLAVIRLLSPQHCADHWKGYRVIETNVIGHQQKTIEKLWSSLPINGSH
jgi:hypothetical protein